MRSEDFLSAIGQLDDELLAVGTPTAVRGGAPRKRIAFVVIAAAVAALAALAVAAGLSIRRPPVPPVLPQSEESSSDAGPSSGTAETVTASSDTETEDESSDDGVTGPVTETDVSRDPGPAVIEPVPIYPIPTDPPASEPFAAAPEDETGKAETESKSEATEASSSDELVRTEPARMDPVPADQTEPPENGDSPCVDSPCSDGREPEPTEPAPTEPEPTEPVETEESRTDGVPSSGNTPSDTESDPVGGSESESGSPSGTSDVPGPGVPVASVDPTSGDDSGTGPGTEDPTDSGSETGDPGPDEIFLTTEWLAFRLYRKEGKPENFIPDQQSHMSGQGQGSIYDSYKEWEKADLWFSFFVLERPSSGSMSDFYLSVVISEIREKPLTRGYAAFCLWYYAKYLGVELPVLRECDGFSDVYDNTYFGQAMIAVYRAGIMDSLTESEFGSDRAATREELIEAIDKTKALQGAD